MNPCSLETKFWETILEEHLLSEDTGKFTGMDEYDVRKMGRFCREDLLSFYFQVRKDRLNVFFKEAPQERWVPRAWLWFFVPFWCSHLDFTIFLSVMLVSKTECLDETFCCIKTLFTSVWILKLTKLWLCPLFFSVWGFGTRCFWRDQIKKSWRSF